MAGIVLALLVKWSSWEKIIRRGENTITGDMLGDELSLAYFDASGVTQLDTAPTLPGNYWVLVDIYEKGNDVAIMSKMANFQIRIKKTSVTNNNSSYYADACSYYNNKTILVTGEGFTEDEQEEFEAIQMTFFISLLSVYERVILPSLTVD